MELVRRRSADSGRSLHIIGCMFCLACLALLLLGLCLLDSRVLLLACNSRRPEAASDFQHLGADLHDLIRRGAQ